MAQAYVYIEVSEYSHRNPLGVCPLPLPFVAFLLTSFGWHHEVMNQIFDSTDERYTIRHLTGQVRSNIVQRTFCPLHFRYIFILSVAYTVYNRFVRHTSVTYTPKSVS